MNKHLPLCCIALAITVLSGVALAAQQSQSSAVGPEMPGSVTPSTNAARLVKFGGTLRDVSGVPLTGTIGVTMAIYKEQQGGTPLWMETQNVSLDAQGNYSLLLGATQSGGLPLDLFATGESRWLGVQAQLPGEIEQPRVLLVSVPYALKAADADTLGGKPLSAFVLAAPDATGTPAASTIDSGQQIVSRIAAAVSGAAVSSPVTTNGGTLNKLPKWDSSTDLVDSAVFESGGQVGIGTVSPATTLDVAGTIRAAQQISSAEPLGASLIPNVNAANGFRSGFGNNLYFDGSNWRTGTDGVHNAGAGILTDIGNGSLVVYTLPTTGGADQVVSNSSFGGFEKMRITPAGNVGINTASPTTTLDVAGTIRAAQQISSAEPLGASLIPNFNAANGFRSGFGNNLYFDGSNWRTGTDGVNNAGAGILTDIGNGSLVVYTLPATGGADQVVSNASFPSFEKLRITPAGNVGIGTTTPGFKLDVAGSVNASGGVTATSFSGSGASLTGLNASNISSGTVQIANGGTGVTAAQGNGAKVQLSTGTTTVNDCVKFDANGNTVDAGAACGSGGGGVSLSAANTFTTGPQTVQTGADPNKGVVIKGNSATQSANLQEWQDSSGNALASVNQSGAISAPVGMLVAHANWDVFGGIDCANFTAFPCSPGTSTATQLSGGVVDAVTDIGVNSFDDSTDTQGLYSDVAKGLNRPGAFLTARARWISAVGTATHVFSIIAGGQYTGLCAAGSETNCFQNGFGFKAVDGVLKGITMVGGVGGQTVVDLATALTTGTSVDLMAIRRATSVDFYVNGIFKGSSSTNLPTTASSLFEVRTENGASGGVAEVQVAMLTVGIPMK